MNREERISAIRRLREKMQVKHHQRGGQGYHRPHHQEIIRSQEVRQQHHITHQQAIDNWVHIESNHPNAINQPVESTLPKHQKHR